MKGDWSATERSGDGAHRNWISLEATSFPVHKTKCTFSRSVVRKVTFPHQFLSSPSDLWLLVTQATNTSQSRIPSCEAKVELKGVWDILGGGGVTFVRWRVGVAPGGLIFEKNNNALDKLTHV